MAYNLTKFYSIFLPFDPWEFDDATMIHPYPGYALLLVPFLRLFLLFRKKTDVRMKMTDGFLIAGLLILIVSTGAFPWQFFTWFLAKIQFSWRFYGPASVLLCLAGSLYFDMLLSGISHRKTAIALMLTAAVLSGVPVLIHTFNAKMYPLERLILSDKIVSGANISRRISTFSLSKPTRAASFTTKQKRRSAAPDVKNSALSFPSNGIRKGKR